MSGERGDDAWRPIFAALGNADTRSVYARIVLLDDDPGSALSPSRARRAIAALRTAGLIEESSGGRLRARDDAFSAILRASPRRPPRVGVGRFLTPAGRIENYPASAADRRMLWDHVVSQSIAPHELLTESELNSRLGRFDDDVAALRRHLVDEGFLERLPNGSEYRRPDSAG